MRAPEKDVELMDGEGFFVQDAPYKEHLRTAFQTKQVRIDPILNCRSVRLNST